MLNLFKKENGYSLLITLLIIILFSILGSSLIFLTSNGAQKNISRENTTQALDLATKGITRIQVEIQNKLTQGIPEKGFNNSQFESLFNQVIFQYSCKNSSLR